MRTQYRDCAPDNRLERLRLHRCRRAKHLQCLGPKRNGLRGGHPRNYLGESAGRFTRLMKIQVDTFLPIPLERLR